MDEPTDDKPRAYPTTPDEWWRNFDAWQPEIRRIVSNYHPTGNRPGGPEMLITAPAAEEACAGIRLEIAIETAGRDPLAEFDAAAPARDWKALNRIMSAAWFGAPESTGVMAVPGFPVLCDLLSEAHVFAPPEEEEVP